MANASCKRFTGSNGDQQLGEDTSPSERLTSFTYGAMMLPYFWTCTKILPCCFLNEMHNSRGRLRENRVEVWCTGSEKVSESLFSRIKECVIQCWAVQACFTSSILSMSNPLMYSFAHTQCVLWILLLLFHVIYEITNPLGLGKQINRRPSQFHDG